MSIAPRALPTPPIEDFDDLVSSLSFDKISKLPNYARKNLFPTVNNSSSNRLDDVYQSLHEKRERFIGYPVNQSFDYTPLFRFLEFSFNNYGYPFHYSNYSLNTHDVERTVISTFAELLGTSISESWGYVTSGTTESHIFSLFAARERYPDGIVYYSTSTHSSIAKAIRILGMTSIPAISPKWGNRLLRTRIPVRPEFRQASHSSSQYRHNYDWCHRFSP